MHHMKDLKPRIGPMFLREPIHLRSNDLKSLPDSLKDQVCEPKHPDTWTMSVGCKVAVIAQAYTTLSREKPV
jgi:hypothetical protein